MAIHGISEVMFATSALKKMKKKKKDLPGKANKQETKKKENENTT